MMRPRQAQSKAQTDSSVPNLGGLSGVASSQERPMAEKTMQARRGSAKNAKKPTHSQNSTCVLSPLSLKHGPRPGQSGTSNDGDGGGESDEPPWRRPSHIRCTQAWSRPPRPGDVIVADRSAEVMHIVARRTIDALGLGRVLLAVAF